MVECLINLLRTASQYPNIWQTSARFSQKHRFSLMRFDQANLAVGPGDSDRIPGKTGSGPDIRNTKIPGRKMSGQKQRLTVVALDRIG
jgi:hypothetical protein